jgi:glutamyl/glutaminyl-tRNA synthetase
VKEFDISKVSKSSCVVSLEKLESLNKMWLMKKMEDPNQLKELIQSIRAEIDKSDWEMSDESMVLYHDQDYFKSLVLACKDRVRKIPDFKHYLKPFFVSLNQISDGHLQELKSLNVDTRGNIFISIYSYY